MCIRDRYCRLTLTELDALRDAATCSELTALLVRSARLQCRFDDRRAH
jgi:hypothetical protein